MKLIEILLIINECTIMWSETGGKMMNLNEEQFKVAQNMYKKIKCIASITKRRINHGII